MASPRSNGYLLGLAAALLGLAGWLTWRWIKDSNGISEQAFYYDLSERRLFVGERGLIPPILGTDGVTEDGVRAVVVSTNGRPADKSTWVIAYLETCAPELKQDLSAAKAAGTAPSMSRGAAQGLRLVKRPGDTNWYSLATAEGEAVVNEWLSWGTAGVSPVICSP